ncbi:MAG: hypothetical protein ACRD26_10335 [Vicinamibacterales bacterium]
MLRWLSPAVFTIALAGGGCAEPPNKEMDQAQGALDAAKAAGAEQYATDEYAAAVDALARSHDAVAQSDYRLALNHALDSRERAQNAARLAADGKAQVRGEVERTMAEVSGLIVQANARLETARKARVPRRRLAGPAQAVATISEEMQKAGELLKTGTYLEARPLLQNLKSRIQKAIAAIAEAEKPAAGRPRR